MEHQPVDEQKSRISRSTARHLRRKRLVAARRNRESSQSEYKVVHGKEKTLLNQEASSSVVSQNSNSKLQFVSPDHVEHNIINKDSKSSNILDIKRQKSVSIYDSNTSDSSCNNSELNKKKLMNPKIFIKIDENQESQGSGSQTSIDCSLLVNNNILINKQFSNIKMDSQEKSKEEIKAEREAKKAAKAAAKSKPKLKVKAESEHLPQSHKVENLQTQEKSNSKLSISNFNPDTPSINFSQSMKQSDAVYECIEKSKAELKAERRAKQEAQRIAKQATSDGKKKQVKNLAEKTQEKVKVPLNEKEPAKKLVAKSELKNYPHEVNIFKHSYINKNSISQLINRDNVQIHPAILRLGVQYAERIIVGSNARCVALLAALKKLVEDFERPPQADFTRGLETKLQESVNYLNFCRPSAVSMQNALKHLKLQMSVLPTSVSDKEAKLELVTAIDKYVREQIILARKAISDTIQKKISNGDVILTYGFSSLIYNVLHDAYSAGKQFRVVVIDGRPWLEGRELLRRLVKHGIDCSYMMTDALSFIMPQVSQVFLGAHAILANGAVMSRVGTAQVALIANTFNVPVFVACETHKSCERTLTDSIVYNEIGDPEQLVKNTLGSCKKSCLSNWKTRKMLNLLNITYDVTPADLVTAVVTELLILPCISVPVILRIKPTEI